MWVMCVCVLCVCYVRVRVCCVRVRLAGATGHTLGAAGGLEAIAAVQAIATKTLPPTINLQTPDPDCDLNYVPNKAVTLPEVKATISQNLGEWLQWWFCGVPTRLCVCVCVCVCVRTGC
jgi:hypothetical protein